MEKTHQLPTSILNNIYMEVAREQVQKHPPVPNYKFDQTTCNDNEESIFSDASIAYIPGIFNRNEVLTPIDPKMNMLFGKEEDSIDAIEVLDKLGYKYEPKRSTKNKDNQNKVTGYSNILSFDKMSEGSSTPAQKLSPNEISPISSNDIKPKPEIKVENKASSPKNIRSSGSALKTAMRRNSQLRFSRIEHKKKSWMRANSLPVHAVTFVELIDDEDDEDVKKEVKEEVKNEDDTFQGSAALRYYFSKQNDNGKNNYLARARSLEPPSKRKNNRRKIMNFNSKKSQKSQFFYSSRSFIETDDKDKLYDSFNVEDNNKFLESPMLLASPTESKVEFIAESKRNSITKELEHFRKNFGSLDNSFEGHDLFIPEVDDETYSPANFRQRRGVFDNKQETNKSTEETEGGDLVEMMNKVMNKKGNKSNKSKGSPGGFKIQPLDSSEMEAVATPTTKVNTTPNNKAKPTISISAATHDIKPKTVSPKSIVHHVKSQSIAHSRKNSNPVVIASRTPTAKKDTPTNESKTTTATMTKPVYKKASSFKNDQPQEQANTPSSDKPATTTSQKAPLRSLLSPTAASAAKSKQPINKINNKSHTGQHEDLLKMKDKLKSDPVRAFVKQKSYDFGATEDQLMNKISGMKPVDHKVQADHQRGESARKSDRQVKPAHQEKIGKLAEDIDNEDEYLETFTARVEQSEKSNVAPKVYMRIFDKVHDEDAHSSTPSSVKGAKKLNHSTRVNANSLVGTPSSRAVATVHTPNSSSHRNTKMESRINELKAQIRLHSSSVSENGEMTSPKEPSSPQQKMSALSKYKPASTNRSSLKSNNTSAVEKQTTEPAKSANLTLKSKSKSEVSSLVSSRLFGTGPKEPRSPMSKSPKAADMSNTGSNTPKVTKVSAKTPNKSINNSPCQRPATTNTATARESQNNMQFSSFRNHESRNPSICGKISSPIHSPTYLSPKGSTVNTRTNLNQMKFSNVMDKIDDSLPLPVAHEKVSEVRMSQTPQKTTTKHVSSPSHDIRAKKAQIEEKKSPSSRANMMKSAVHTGSPANNLHGDDNNVKKDNTKAFQYKSIMQSLMNKNKGI